MFSPGSCELLLDAALSSEPCNSHLSTCTSDILLSYKFGSGPSRELLLNVALFNEPCNSYLAIYTSDILLSYRSGLGTSCEFLLNVALSNKSCNSYISLWQSPLLTFFHLAKVTRFATNFSRMMLSLIRCAKVLKIQFWPFITPLSPTDCFCA